MTQANFSIATKEAVFDAGTVGGQWAWALEETESLPGPAAAEAVTWLTDESFTSAEVQPGTTYKVSGSRVDVNKNQLGEAVSALFTTEEVPEQVIIDVASTISVELS